MTCAVASVLLAGVLVAPLLRRRGSVVDAEQQIVRQDRRGGLARSGADIALLVLAGLGVWQLRAYRSPVDERARHGSTPCSSRAPALLLLAGAVLALRLLPRSRASGSGWRRAAGRSSPRSPRGRSADGRAARRGRCCCSRSRWRSARSPSRSSARGGPPRGTRRTSGGTDVRLERLDGSGIEQAGAVDASPACRLSARSRPGVPMGRSATSPARAGAVGEPPRVDTAQAEGCCAAGAHRLEAITIPPPPRPRAASRSLATLQAHGRRPGL